MLRLPKIITGIFFLTSVLISLSVKAAGSVEMQVESIIRQSLQSYNTAMDTNQVDDWLKYFSDKVSRQSPLSEQSGKQEFTEFFNSEFKSFKAQYAVKQILVHGRNAAVVLIWEAQHKASGDLFKVPMVAIFDMDTSGRFASVNYYYDTGKLGKFAKEMTGPGN